MATSTTDKGFLVKFSQKFFYLARTPGDARLHGTLFMSYAMRFSYLCACEIALRIRKLGWGDALVTNLNGDPISLENAPAEQFTPVLDERELVSAWDKNVRAPESEIPDAPPAEEARQEATPEKIGALAQFPDGKVHHEGAGESLTIRIPQQD